MGDVRCPRLTPKTTTPLLGFVGDLKDKAALENMSLLFMINLIKTDKIKFTNKKIHFT